MPDKVEKVNFGQIGPPPTPTVFVLPDHKHKSKCDCFGSKCSLINAQDTCQQFAGYKKTPVSRVLPVLM